MYDGSQRERPVAPALVEHMIISWATLATSRLARHQVHRVVTVALTTALIGLCGCAVNLMPTPTIYAERGRTPFDTLPESRCTAAIPVVFATDRQPLEEARPNKWYSYERSPSMAYGTLNVNVGKDLDWDGLREASKSASRPTSLPLSISDVVEIGRFPVTPLAIGLRDGLPLVSDEDAAELELAEGRFCDVMREALSCDDSGRVLLFVHGYNNSFRDACVIAGQVWHFLGRRGAVVAYSWPAGIGGLRGYTHDRESGEFTVVHLKQLIRALAACDAVKRIDVLSHSRGTDVATTALRELHLESSARGDSTRRSLKLGHLVLAAPDLDVQVVGQRIVGEGLHLVPETFTVYFSADDNAIGLANWLFLGVVRLGGLAPGRLGPAQRERISVLQDVIEFIDVRVPSGFFGHSYFYESPAVSSDLVLLMAEDRLPGAEHGRPLRRDDIGFWYIDEDYPRPERLLPDAPGGEAGADFRTNIDPR